MTDHPIWHQNTEEGKRARAAAIGAAPRGTWLSGYPSPVVGFFPRRQPNSGMPAAAPYGCVCASDRYWCNRGRCGCAGRERGPQPSERPSGYGVNVPAPLAGLPPSCCAIIALISGRRS